MVGSSRTTPSKAALQVDTNASRNGESYSNYSYTPNTEASTPGANRYNIVDDDADVHANDNANLNLTANNAIGPATPQGFRGHSDLRSPGVSKTPDANVDVNGHAQGPLPDFMTQTDKYGNAIAPANPVVAHIPNNLTDETEKEDSGGQVDTLLESLRMMCCCILPEPAQVQHYLQKEVQPPQKSPTVHSIPLKQIMKEDVDVPHDIRLLPSVHPKDPKYGKKCLVLDLDETLVHSSFRAVPGADFVIPVQIDDVVHFVYVIKRPGVDEFLIEMAKHYEIVIYTASLNKYADPLLDLLDPQKTINYRLFRESCVYYEGSYVKDLNLINRDLTQSIIIDNSPASYLFHPQNAIDCSSFIDDPADLELYQIGSFLKGVKNVNDVRGVMNMWQQWPRIPRIPLVEYPEHYDEDDRQVPEPLQLNWTENARRINGIVQSAVCNAVQ
eukprot:scaffold1819_cov292-Chaetoceros_neogracile.AAC.2